LLQGLKLFLQNLNLWIQRAIEKGSKGYLYFESECLNPLQLRLVILNAAYSYDSIFTYYVYGFKCSAEYQYVTR